MKEGQSMKHGMIRVWVSLFLFAAAVNRLIAEKRLAGAVVMVARHGKVGATR
jgi:hypothetical protein